MCELSLFRIFQTPESEIRFVHMVCLPRIRLCEMIEGRPIILIGAQGGCRDVCTAPRSFLKLAKVDLIISPGIRISNLVPSFFLSFTRSKKTSRSLAFKNMLGFVEQGSVCKPKEVALFVYSPIKIPTRSHLGRRVQNQRAR